MKKKKDALLGLAAAAVFSVLYLAGALTSLEYLFYDFFLGFRANRERIDSVVFLDIDDQAIAYYGIFPWPRSIPADGLLRLKEYGARAAIFDIEYIDRGPQGVDSLYLDYGLGNDFFRSFSEINTATQEVLSAIRTGQIGRSDINHYANVLSSLIQNERQNLYNKAQNVARDNDIYLAQALALYNRSWTTLNLREFPLEGEQAERRTLTQERFSYPVNASPNASRGAGFIDILPPLPVFANASNGAGFTNVEIDNDGVRRRVFLAQNIDDHWYLQLAFAPLINYLGNPEIILEKSRLIIKQAQMPGGRVKDIVIPLDSRGRMMLDWPKEDYYASYTHISFANFSLLDEIEVELEQYSRILADTDILSFVQFDSSLSVIPVMLNDIGNLFDAAQEARHHAMEKTSDDSFDAYIKHRNYAYELLGEVLTLDVITKLEAVVRLVNTNMPQYIEYFIEEAEYIAQLIEALEINLTRHEELTLFNTNALHDKFVILGRVDTGTTDYGANPFHGKYINVGTHGVVLDTILSESFIILLNIGWRILSMLIIVPLFFLFSAGFPPVVRASTGFGATIIIFVVTILVFRFTGVFMGPLGIILAMIAGIIIREIISYAGSEKEKQFIRTAFSTYVSSDIVKEIIADPSRLQLGGTKRSMTALFTDIKGFSTISEQLTPEDLVNLLNKYLSAMSDAVLAEKGTIDKYIGDAIVAFFGAPLDLPDHALRACVAAITMKKIEAELNKTVMEQKLSPIPIFTRIGINTGYMVAGNMGTANKMNYTIMGNAVNLSARLEGVNSQYGTQILASENTIRETGDHLLYRKLDRVRVVGINEPVRLCELIDIAEAAGEQDKKLVKVFHEALENFEKRLWKQAVEGFNEALVIKPEDALSKIYLDRLKQFSVAMPDDSWDGVYNLTSK
jgi:adenylate cyclase